MTNFLIKKFIDKDASSLDQRQQYGRLSSGVGIVVNIVLALVKIAFGLLTGSIAILGDGVNNFFDTASSVVSMISFHVSSKPADKNHPFGYARFEYISSAIVATIILLVGGSILKESVVKILNPQEINIGWASLLMLILSILVKIWLYFFYKKLGKAINSELILANAQDSMGDVIASSAIVIALLIYSLSGLNLDGPMGLIVAVIIIKAGWDILMTSFNHIMGTPASPELLETLEKRFTSYNEVHGMHDLMVHDYGPGKKFVTVHLEVDAETELYEAHRLVEQIEHEVEEEDGVQVTIHLDPISTSTPEIRKLRQQVVDYIGEHHGSHYKVHAFRVTSSFDKDSVLFNLSVPLITKDSNSELRQQISKDLNHEFPDYNFLITIDRDFKN